MGNIYGYVRVSSIEQNEDRQMIALKKARVSDSHIFMDKQSGKDFHRADYEKMVSQLHLYTYGRKVQVPGDIYLPASFISSKFIVPR